MAVLPIERVAINSLPGLQLAGVLVAGTRSQKAFVERRQASARPRVLRLVQGFFIAEERRYCLLAELILGVTLEGFLDFGFAFGVCCIGSSRKFRRDG